MPTAAASPQLSLTPITNGTTFAAGQTLNISVAANNPGLPILVDFYLGVVAPDGKTIVFITQGAAFGVGSISNLASFVPFVTGLSLTTPFNVTVPLFSHLWDGTEPAGPYVLFVEAWRSGSTELVARGQSFFTH